MWGVAFPREWVDVAWTSFGRRSDVVFFQYISYPLSHTSLSDSLFISQQTVIKNDPSAACSAAHATQKPNTSYRLLFLKLPPPPCPVLLVSVNQNESKVLAAFRWGKADFQHTGHEFRAFLYGMGNHPNMWNFMNSMSWESLWCFDFMSNVLGVFLEMVSPSKVLFREMPAIMDAMATEAHHWQSCG